MIFKGLLEDARSIRDRDPAARTHWKLFLLYQGFHALFYHQIRRTGCTNTSISFLRVRCRSLRGI